MTWWGKVIGGTFGFLVGGPLGILLGVALGHGFDKGLALERPLLQGAAQGGGAGGAAGGADVETVQSAFFTATFSVLGHLAKADGLVTTDEIAMARGVMAQMRLSEEQKRVAIRLFEQGKQPDFPLDDTLAQFRRLCQRRHSLLQMFLEILVGMALADREMHADEHRVLSHVALQLGFRAEDYQAIVRRMQAQEQVHRRPGKRETLDEAYRLLGLGRSASVDEIKKSYRRLMNQHHPDKLVSKGLPEEMMDIAVQKTRDIQEAYELIKKSRGF